MPKTSTLLRIDADLLEKIKQDADKNERSLNGHIVYILKQYLNQ